MITLTRPWLAVVLIILVCAAVSNYGLHDTAEGMVLIIGGLIIYRIWANKPTI